MKKHDSESTSLVNSRSRRSSDYQPGWSDEEGTDSPSGEENPLRILLQAMYGHWRSATILGLILCPIFAAVGYLLAPIRYKSASVLAVESTLPALVEETIETAGIPELASFVGQQTQYIRDPLVFRTAFDSAAMTEFALNRDGFRESIVSQLKVLNPMKTSLLIVEMEDEDPVFAATAVNAIVDAYMEIYAPDAKADYRVRLESIKSMAAATAREVENLKVSRNTLLSDARYGISDSPTIIAENVAEIRQLELEIEEVQTTLDGIREQYIREVRSDSEDADVAIESIEIPPSTSRTPSVEQLAELEPSLLGLQENLRQATINFAVTKERFGEGHFSYKRERGMFEKLQSSFDATFESAERRWLESVGDRFQWGALQERLSSLQNDVQSLVQTNAALYLELIEVEEFEGKIKQKQAELEKLEERRMEIERESDSIRQGRVKVRTKATEAFLPSDDKRFAASVAGAAGGLGFSFGIFLLIGLVGQKTFGVSQLRDGSNSFRVLGVLPNMDEELGAGSASMLATDCIHRIRGRIESLRSPETGYAMMVSSPFQGDGKTTLAVSLAWSYAESGYRTLLVDADFIGRAMSHQFGRLKEPGLREVLRSERAEDAIVLLGHPNLSLLGVGFDRRVSAANISPRNIGRLIESLRSSYDVILFDTGPMSASIEALPISSAVDGVVLTIRRGRARSRLRDCVSDIKSTGADYLGVVLNYADMKDCMRYGSNSVASEDVRLALESGDSDSAGSRAAVLRNLGVDEAK